MMPVIPHFANECFEKIKFKIIKWAKSMNEKF